MPALSRGQENTTSILNWFIMVNGVLTDAYEVGYQIYDITGGVPGTQIFPAVAGTWEDVTSAPGNFSPGSYYAYDNTAGTGYTPSIAEALGTHRVTWRWKISAGAPYQSGSEDFEVITQSSGSTTDTYVTIQDVRDAGFSDVTAWPDATILYYIELCQSLIDRACRQWFTPKDLTIKFDGTDSDSIHFGVPIISIEYLKVNGRDDELDTSLYKVYNSRLYPDDRRNPRIKLVQSNQYYSIFTASSYSGTFIFRKGRQNNEVKGVFGFVEEDMSVPRPIKRAMLKLIAEKMPRPLYVADPTTAPVPPPPILGSIIEEESDWHRVKYSMPGGGETSVRSPYLTGITSDPEIIDIVKMYRAPLGIASPVGNSYR